MKKWPFQVRGPGFDLYFHGNSKNHDFRFLYLVTQQVALIPLPPKKSCQHMFDTPSPWAADIMFERSLMEKSIKKLKILFLHFFAPFERSNFLGKNAVSVCLCLDRAASLGKTSAKTMERFLRKTGNQQNVVLLRE